MLKRVEITAHGGVQGVNYRAAVKRIADALGVHGTVENQPDGSVRIVAEADEAVLLRFADAIRIRRWPINVGRAEAAYSGATREFSSFSIIR